MPTSNTPLTGIRVLVTRPESQAHRLVTLIDRAGGEPIRFPTLAIAPIQPSEDEVEALARSDMVIFISPNAAAYGYPILRDLAADRQVIAIGRRTRAVLEEMECRDVHDPGDRSSSEALLEHAVLNDVATQRICIVRGQGGRELLRQSLSSRGARVSYLECYRRTVPEAPHLEVLDHALDLSPESLVVTSTSTAGLINLLHVVPNGLRDRLLATPLVVIGARQDSAAREQGWLGPVLEAGASDEQIVETIIGWRNPPQEPRD